MGCRHAHGLDIVWSARHGATSTLPEIAPAVLPEITVTVAQRPGRESRRRDLEILPRSDGALRRATFDGPLDRAGVARLMLLRGFLCLGAAALLGSGTAVATMHAGVIAAVTGMAFVVMVTGLLALRGTPAGAFVGRLDRVLPTGRRARPSRELLSVRAPRSA